MTKSINLAILIAGMDRPDLVIEDFWRSAQSAVGAANVQINCIAVHAVRPGTTAIESQADIEVATLVISIGGRGTRAVDSLTKRKNTLGVIARLLQYNLYSMRIAHALAQDKKLIRTFCRSDVIVSADPEADRAVWRLRGRTKARLLHGPFAMSNALSEVAKA